MTSQVVYRGQLRCTLTHNYSGTQITTDAPLDNQGLAQAFSPTDLVATALGACMLSIMGIKARDMQLDITGATVEITKVMASNPRRISEVHANITMPANNFSAKDQTILENTARTCPVAYSLHPDIVQQINFNWQ